MEEEIDIFKELNDNLKLNNNQKTKKTFKGYYLYYFIKKITFNKNREYREYLIKNQTENNYALNFLGKYFSFLLFTYCLSKKITISGKFKRGDNVIVKKVIHKVYDDSNNFVEEELPYWSNIKGKIQKIELMYNPFNFKPVNVITVAHNNKKYGCWSIPEEDLIKI